MPVQVSGAYAVVSMLNRAFNDISPSNAAYYNMVAYIEAHSAREFAQEFGNGFRGMTTDALATKLLGNMGLLPNGGLQVELKNYLDAVGTASVGIVALQLGQILSGLENATGSQAAYAAQALAWNNEVTASHIYSTMPSLTLPAAADKEWMALDARVRAEPAPDDALVGLTGAAAQAAGAWGGGV